MTQQAPNDHLSPKAIRKRLRRFDKTFRLYRAELVRRYGEERAQAITDATRSEYERLLPETPRFPGRINVFNMVMGINALIVALRLAMRAQGHPVQETGAVLYAVAEQQHAALSGTERWLASKAVFSRWFLRIARTSAANVHDHPEGWKIDYRKEDGEEADWSFHCQECGVIEYFKCHGVPELGAYCNYVDYIQSRVLHMGMQNPQNLGQGDPACIERFKRGRETVLPENLKEIVSKEEPAASGAPQGAEVVS